MESRNRTTIAASVDRSFVGAATYFAGKVNMTVSAYVKAAIQRRSADLLKDKLEEFQTYKAVENLQRDAIERGTWSELAAAAPDVYPATLEGWQALAKQQAKLVAKAEKEIAEMDRQIEAMGHKVLM